MTHSLPENASLEWLKKTAKQRKKALAEQGIDVTLSACQFELAKEYGFASWREVKAHFDKDTESAEQARAFFDAVTRDHVKTVVSMINAAPDLVGVVADHPFWGGQLQALHLAVEGHRPEMVATLLAAGADVNGHNAGYDHWSPLMLALKDERGDIEKMLRDAGARVGPCEALLAGDDAFVTEWFAVKRKANFDRPGGSLIALARTPHAVRVLLDAGYSVTEKDRWGSNAMDALSRVGAAGKPLVEALVRAGETALGRDIARLGDLQALKSACETNPTWVNDPSVLMAAVDFGHIDSVAWLLSQGADVQSRHDFGSEGTALHSAAWGGNLAMVTLLLDHGADVDALDTEYRTTPKVWAETARRVTNNPDCEAVAALLAQQIP